MDSGFYRKMQKRFDLLAGLKKLVRNKKVMIGIVVGAALAGFVVFGNHGLLQRTRLTRQKAELEQKIREAEEETRTLQAQSKALESDKKVIEKVARERYGMVRSGEKVYKVKREER